MDVDFSFLETDSAGHLCRCGDSETRERLMLERVPVGEDDHFEVEVPVIECVSCGFSYTDHRAETLRQTAAYHHQGLLAPHEVKAVRKGLGMSRREFGEAYGLPPASVERWENGRLMQNTSLDTLLRALQNKATASRLDRRIRAERAGGEVIAGRFPTLEKRAEGLDDARRRANGFKLHAVA